VSEAAVRHLVMGVVVRAAGALFALLLASSPIHASQKGIPASCRAIGSMLGALEQDASANDAVPTSLMDRLARHNPAALRAGDWKSDYSAWGPSADAVKTSADPLANTDKVARFGHSGIGVVRHIGGTASCEWLDFFKVVGGKVYPIDPPPSMPETCARHGGSAWAGSLRGVPVLATEQDWARDSIRITLVPLLNGRWGHRCRIDVGFAPGLCC